MNHLLISRGQSEHSHVYDEFLFYSASMFLKHSNMDGGGCRDK